MRTLITTACMLSASTFTLGVGAAVTPPSVIQTTVAAESVSGVIASVAENGESFELRTSEGLTSVKVDEDTTFMLDGERSTRAAALQPGHSATVDHKDGLAKMVNVTTKDTPTLF